MCESGKQLLLWIFSHRGKKNSKIHIKTAHFVLSFQIMNITKTHQIESTFSNIFRR